MNDKEVQLNGLCYRYIGGVLMSNETVRVMIHQQIEKLLKINRWEKEGQKLTKILGSLDDKETIHLPVERWKHINPDFFTHVDRHLADDDEALMQKYGKKLSILLKKEFELDNEK